MKIMEENVVFCLVRLTFFRSFFLVFIVCALRKMKQQKKQWTGSGGRSRKGEQLWKGRTWQRRAATSRKTRAFYKYLHSLENHSIFLSIQPASSSLFGGLLWILHFLKFLPFFSFFSVHVVPLPFLFTSLISLPSPLAFDVINSSMFHVLCPPPRARSWLEFEATPTKRNWIYNRTTIFKLSFFLSTSLPSLLFMQQQPSNIVELWTFLSVMSSTLC